MKYNSIYTSQFKRDMKKCAGRHYDMNLLQAIMRKIQDGEPLDSVQNRPHFLTGKYPKIIECHILGDWLLEYRYDRHDVIFVRTGTHSDLFR
ncbi:RelE/StbE family addiction module toxin [Clostridia bacterium]|nr:RelE/StbE family addiction module toxin [Clostridia bacterium]